MLVVLHGAAAGPVLDHAAQEGLRGLRCASCSRPPISTTSASSSTAATASGTACSSLASAGAGAAGRVLRRRALRVFILAIAGVGLMLLIGYTGLASLGHGAFMAIGAYTNTYLITKGVPFLDRLPGRRARGAGGRHRRRPACQPHDRHLSRHRHAGVLADRRADRGALGIGDARLPGHAGAGARHLRPSAEQGLGVLLSVPRRAGAGGARRHQSDALAHGPRDGGDPRLGDLGAKPRRQPRALQDRSPSR